jgi:opacity protein-like surface antigen
MRGKTYALAAVLLVWIVPAAAAAQAPRSTVSIQPFAAYGFYGDLPGGPRLEAAPAFGVRGTYHLTEEWGIFGEWQRSTPEARGLAADPRLDHWSAGVEFSYSPRGGAEGMLPIIFEVGLGQARYDWPGVLGGSSSDLAVNLGVASALRMTPDLALRFGVNDYISSYRDNRVVNQIFGRVGVELSF